jgi:hypothetical protein
MKKTDAGNETARLRMELRQVQKDLQDAHMELALEKAYLTIACERIGEPVKGFRTKHAGRQSKKQSKPARS